jgi:hypothetical protein
VPSSHNNEKEFMRRLESYKQLLQEDVADLFLAGLVTK